MSTEIAVTESGLPVLPSRFDDDAFGAVATSSKFLPRLQLFTSNSDPVKEGKIPMGTYGLVTGKDQITTLGDEVSVLVLAWRPKALDLGGDDIVSSFDHNSDLFKSIQKQAEVPNSGCMFGPEFLVWIPSLETFATFFMGSKSMRRESPNVKALLGGPATLKVTLIKTPKYKWHNTITTKCSTPFNIPDLDDVLTHVEVFNNPPAEEKEPADQEPRAR